MRVYHFTDAKYGLEDISLRRLKVARIAELNDPFEFMAPKFENADWRNAWRQLFEEANEIIGFLCFSQSWRNPVQWSHYADKHRGLCMGFDVPDRRLNRVRYISGRDRPDLNSIMSNDNVAHEFLMSALTSKFSHWRYEQEFRWFVNLSRAQESNGNLFRSFCDEFELKEVIVGANSDVSRAEITNALGENEVDVRCKKARLAFKSFRVVEQRSSTRWL